MQKMYPDLFEQLLTFVEYSVKPPRYGNMETKTMGIVKGPSVCFDTEIFDHFTAHE